MALTGQQAADAGRDALQAYAKRVKPDTLRKVGDEIRAVRDLLAGEPRLRRALTDPGRSTDDRAGLAENLLSGKISAGALKIVLALVKQRWSTPAELLSAAEDLGVEALLTAGQSQDVLGDVEDELFRFSRVVDGDPALASALGDSTSDSQARAQLVNTLLSGKANPITVRLAEIAALGFGGRGFESALLKLVERCAEKREERVAYVTVATALSDDQESRLTEKLSQLYGQPVSAEISVDPEVVGGIKVQVGHDLFDGTVARRLTEARKALGTRR